jgi:hypothetical protein
MSWCSFFLYGWRTTCSGCINFQNASGNCFFFKCTRVWKFVLIACSNRVFCVSRRYIESNTGKSAGQGNLRHPRVRFQSFTDEVHRVSERLKSYPRVSEISLSCTFCRCLILFLTFISSCLLFDSYVLLADDHVNNVSYSPFMSIKKVFLCIAWRLLCNNMADC